MKTLSNGTLLVACMGGVLGSGSLATAGISGYSYKMSSVSQSGWLVPDARDLVTVDIYMNFENSTDFLVAVYGSAVTPLNLMTDDASGFFQSTNGSADTSATFNEALVAINPSMAADSWVTIARTSSTDNNLLNVGLDFTAFNSGGALTVDNGSWFITPDDTQGSAGDAHCYRILLARMSVASGSTVSGSFNLQFTEADGSTTTASEEGFSVTAEVSWVDSANINDFDGNGTADLIIRQCISGASPFSMDAYYSELGGGSPAYLSDYVTAANMTGWTATAFGNFDGSPDNASDVLWSNDASGVFGLWLMDTSLYPATPYTTASVTDSSGAVTMAGYSFIGTGDFDNNGTVDILFQDDSTGGTEMWLMSDTIPGRITQRTVYGSAPSGWSIRAIGDLDGDDDADILWQRDLTAASAPGAVSCWLIDTSIVAPAPPYAAKSIFISGIPGWSIYGLADWDNDGDDDVMWRNNTLGAIGTWQLGGVSGNNLLYAAASITNSQTLGWQLIAFGDYNGDGHVDLMWKSDSVGILAYWAMTSTASAYTGVSYSSVDFNTEPLMLGNVLRAPEIN